MPYTQKVKDWDRYDRLRGSAKSDVMSVQHISVRNAVCDNINGEAWALTNSLASNATTARFDRETERMARAGDTDIGDVDEWKRL